MGREYGRRGGYGRDDDRRGGGGRGWSGGSRGGRGRDDGRDDDRRGGGRGNGCGEERDRYPAAERISKIGGKCGRCDEPIEIGDKYILGLDREGGGTCANCVDDKDEFKPWFPSEESALMMRVLRAVEGRDRRTDRRADPPGDPPEESDHGKNDATHEEKTAHKRARKS